MTSADLGKKEVPSKLVEERPVLEMVDTQAFENSWLILFEDFGNVRLNQIHFKWFAEDTVKVNAWSAGRCVVVVVTGEIDHFRLLGSRRSLY